MDEYIKRETAVKAACDAVWFGGGAPSVTAAINQIPAADVAPVRHGRWDNKAEHLPDPAGFDLIPVRNVWRCSQCGYPVINETEDPDRLFNYCPNCGAKMDQEREE